MQRVTFKSFFQAWCSAQSVCLFLFVTYFVALAVRSFQLNSGDIASWVQAIGAIISIWAAWWIASQQSKRAEIERRRGDLAKCAAILGLLEHILRVVKHKPLENQGTLSRREVRNALQKALSTLDQVDVLVLPDPVVVRAVLEVRHAVEMLDLKLHNSLGPSRDVLTVIQYDFGLSSKCVEVVKQQIDLCKAAVSMFS